MSRLSPVSIVLGAVSIVSMLACTDVAGTAGVSGYYTSGDCSAYGDTCFGEAPTNGAFELGVFPIDDQDVHSVTFTVTYKDAVGGEDIIETITVGESYPGEYWIWSPSAPPSGYVEVTGLVEYYDGVTEPLFCSQDPSGDWYAYNNGWLVYSNEYYSSSKGCYIKVDLDRVIDDQ